MERATAFEKVIIYGAPDGLRALGGPQKVRTWPWHKLGRADSPRDYDAVVINFLHDTSWVADHCNEVFQKFNLAYLSSLTRSGATVVVLGDPRLALSNAQAENPMDIGYTMAFMQWFGVDFEWENVGGERVVYSPNPIVGEESRYLKRIQRWRYSTKIVGLRETALRTRQFGLDDLERRGFRLRVRTVPVLVSQDNGFIAFALTYQLEPVAVVEPRVVGRQVSRLGKWRQWLTGEVTAAEPDMPTGRVIFLPETSLHPDAGLRIAVHELFGVELTATEPTWATKLRVPVETSLDREHADLRERRAAIDRQIEALEGRRAEERNVLRALYSGHEPLQEAVQDLFERMGAVFPPQVDVKKDDGFFDISIDGRSYRFVCEVKSKERAPLGKNAFQQLVEWWDNHSQTGKEPDKGVVIGNTEMALPLGERVDPFPAGGWIGDAEQRGFAVISSSEVFAAWEAGVQSGRGHEDFWRRLLKARGRFGS